MKYNGLFLVKPGENKLTEQRARHAPVWSEEYFEGYNQGFRDGYRRSTAALDEIAKSQNSLSRAGL